MLTVYRSADRGHANHGWLRSFHSFSFADYHNPERMGWGNLRVINEDFVTARRGFGTHPHRDMEIVTYMLSGVLTHRDSMGHTCTIGPGEVQRMTAGTGIQHSEINEGTEPVHLLQIWILPQARGLTPSYGQTRLQADDLDGRLHLVAAPEPGAAVTLQADARLWAGRFNAGASAHRSLARDRKAWVQVARGGIEANGQVLQAGDALALADEPELHLSNGQDAEVLVFDLAP